MRYFFKAKLISHVLYTIKIRNKIIQFDFNRNLCYFKLFNFKLKKILSE